MGAKGSTVGTFCLSLVKFLCVAIHFTGVLVDDLSVASRAFRGYSIFSLASLSKVKNDHVI